MQMLTIMYEADSGGKITEIIEYEYFDEVCEALIERYKQGNLFVYAETEKFLLWICDPAHQIHVAYRAEYYDRYC